MPASRLSQRGFTLIEVLVAFAIFTLTVGAIYEAFAGANRRGAQARERELHLLTAQSLLAELRTRAPPWPSEEKGGDAASGEEWQIEVVPFDAHTDPESVWKAYEVSVTVGSPQSRSAAVVLKSVELARITE
jgi:general secretion pathway protein I